VDSAHRWLDFDFFLVLMLINAMQSHRMTLKDVAVVGKARNERV